MAANTLTKYFKVYRTLLKYGFIQATAYRASFIIQIGVELGYQVMFIVFFLVVFGNVQHIAGWSYYQVLFLAGLNIFTSEIVLGSAFILGLAQLPGAIKDGDIDTALLRPIHALFNLSLARPYVAGMLAALPGLGLMVYAAWHLPPLSPLALGLGSLLLVCGMVIAYSLLVIGSSLCFVFINASALPRIASRVITEYKSNPLDAYQGILRLVLLSVVPVGFITGVPAAVMVHSLPLQLVLASPIVAAVFLLMALTLWGQMIKRYTSASS